MSLSSTFVCRYKISIFEVLYAYKENHFPTIMTFSQNQVQRSFSFWKPATNFQEN